MPRNASGVFNLVELPFQPITIIESAKVNSDLSDISSALTQSIATTGVSSMTGQFKAADGTVAEPSITFASDLNTGIYRPFADEVRLATNGIDAFKWDNAHNSFALSSLFVTSNVVSGSAAALTMAGGTVPRIQALSPDTNAALLATRFSADANPPRVHLAKSRNAAIGGNTIVASGDILGEVRFEGNNGTGFDQAGNIQCIVDGTPGAANDMPSTFVFNICADGSATPTERMAIRANGKIQIPNRTAPTLEIDPTGFIDFDEIATPVNPAASTLRLFSRNSGGVTVLSYLRSDGTLATMVPPASQAEMEAGTSLDRAVIVGRQHFHPGHPKAWGRVNSAGTLLANYNITSVAKPVTGQYDITIANDMSDANYAIIVNVEHAGSVTQARYTSIAAGSFTVLTQDASTDAATDAGFSFVILGDMP